MNKPFNYDSAKNCGIIGRAVKEKNGNLFLITGIKQHGVIIGNELISYRDFYLNYDFCNTRGINDIIHICGVIFKEVNNG